MHSVSLKAKNSSKGSSSFNLKGYSHGSRKVVQSVDTNLNSYDRTDPFQAFTVLLKLIGSLPSRIGGCKFKFSPEEHSLSLHLLNIIEPFVGNTDGLASRRTLTRQPTEILDSIVFHVDAQHDLLALALSCRRMHSIVIPRHLNHRTIRCKVSSISIWNHLIVHRSLARNVRRLEILDERATEPEIVPLGILASDTDLESTDDELTMHSKQERYLVAALTKMTALKVFAWSCNHSPMSIDNVWPTLLKCHSLKEVEINDNLVFSPQILDNDGESAVPNGRARRPSVLPDLRKVTLRSTKHIYGLTRHPKLSRISNMLNHCPNLESLDITYSHPRSSSYPPADDLLLCGRWPHLTTLALVNLRCSPGTGFDAATAFLSSHLNLEVLHLDLSSPAAGLVLPAGSLPRLRELRASKEVANAILACAWDAAGPRPLETIKGIRLSGSAQSQSAGCRSDQVFFANLRKAGNGRRLKRVELAGWNEMDDVRRLMECVPGLTWLDLGKKNSMTSPPMQNQNGNGNSNNGMQSLAPVNNTVEWATLLSALPDLTTFHGIRFFYSTADPAPPLSRDRDRDRDRDIAVSASDRSRMRKNDEIASVLVWKCPKLRRVDHWEGGSGKVVVLVRDNVSVGGAGCLGVERKEKVRWEVRRVKV